MSNVIDLWETGFVQRWHTHPHLARTGQTLAQHQWGVAVLLIELHPYPSVSLLYEALLHDAGERHVGDMGYMVKRANPDVAKALAKMEVDARRDMGVHPRILHYEDSIWLKLCDWLDAFLWARHHAPQILGSDGWPEQCGAMAAMADDLGCGKRVREIIGDPTWIIQRAAE